MGKRHSRHSSSPPARGQALIIVAFAIIALVALVGLAVDLGLVYIERIRVRRAADAAALASAAELPLEAAAQVRALEYLQENSYACGISADYSGGAFTYMCSEPDVRVEVNAGYAGQYVVGPASTAADHIIQVNTVPYRDDVYSADSANRIEVAVTTNVHLYFMRVLGFDEMPVTGRAVGENINNLDVALVFDKSGSMEFDTLCYGCWTQAEGHDYPDGDRWPLPWGGPATGTPSHCSGSGSHREYAGHDYIIIEAEEYSSTNVSYDRDLYVQGMTYWVLQRNGGWDLSHLNGDNSYLRNDRGADALGRDTVGAYVSHHPYRNHAGSDGQGSNCEWDDLLDGGMCLRDSWILSLGGPFPAPRLDYQFSVPDNDQYYVWVRGIGGDGNYNLMWGLDYSPRANVRGDGDRSFYQTGLQYNAGDEDRWRWVKLGGTGNLYEGNSYTLNIWAGATGFDLDRIIITDDPRTPHDAEDQEYRFVSRVLHNTANIDNNRTGQACDPCDARFGGYPGGPGGNQPPSCQIPGFPVEHEANYRYLNWIFDDEQPLRGAAEASKRFITRLDPKYDQIGLVTYSSRATIANPLECVRRLGSDDCDLDVIEDTVVEVLNDTHASGGTNIAEAVLKGIEVLSNTPGQYGRPSAAHIMIVMTDGEANQIGGLDTPTCYAQDYWPQNTGSTSRDQAKDCSVYYARQARNNGIVIYTITLGNTADIELMQYIAELTGGVHRHAPRPEQLDPIFDELYKRIFLRLVE